MKKKLSFVFTALMLFCMLPQVGLAQSWTSTASLLGGISNYEIFTSAGAITNAGKSVITGCVGSGAGAISGFSSSTNTKTAIIATSSVANLNAAIVTLNAYVAPLTPVMALPLVLGANSITPGVSTVTGAASIPTTLSFDGKGNPNSVFVIKVSGAFASAAAASITLQNGATADNIFWLVQGAVAFGAGTTMQGNFISAAAIAVGAGSTINGRLLTTAGAIAVSGLTANNGIMVPPPAPVNITLPSVAHLALFNIYTAAGAITNAGKSKIYQSLNAGTTPIYAGNVGTNAGAISGFTSPVTPESPDNNTIVAALEVGALFTSLGNLIPNNDPLALELGGQTLTSTATSSNERND